MKVVNLEVDLLGWSDVQVVVELAVVVEVVEWWESHLHQATDQHSPLEAHPHDRTPAAKLDQKPLW